MLDPTPAMTSPAHSPAKVFDSAMIMKPNAAITVASVNAARDDSRFSAVSPGICRPPIVPE